MRIAPGLTRFPYLAIRGNLSKVEELRDFIFQASGMAQLASRRNGVWTGWTREPYSLEQVLQKSTCLLVLVLIEPFEEREALKIIRLARQQLVPVVLMACEGSIIEPDWKDEVDEILLAEDFSPKGLNVLLNRFRNLMSLTFQAGLGLP